MQQDQLLAAFSIQRQRMQVVGGIYGADGTQQRLLQLSVMRDFVLAHQSRGLEQYCQQHIEQDRGCMADLLDELWQLLGLAPEATWDQFAQQFLDCNTHL